MAEPRVCMWTGGKPRSPRDYPDEVDHLLALPPPAPLRQSARIAYRWGDSTFEVYASACSVRTTAWGIGEVTWLHCQAMTVAEAPVDVPVGMMAILVPADYVIRIEPGLHFRHTKYQRPKDVGVFPPLWPAPADHVSLAEIDRVLVDLLSPELN